MIQLRAMEKSLKIVAYLFQTHSHTIKWCFNCQLIFAVFNKNVLQIQHIFCR